MKKIGINKVIVMAVLGAVALTPELLHADVIFTTGVNLQVFPYMGIYDGEMNPNPNQNFNLGLRFENNTYAFQTVGYDNFSADSDLILRNSTGVNTDFMPGDKNLFKVAFQVGQAADPFAIKYAAGATIGPDSADGYGWGYLSEFADKHSWADGDRGYAGIAKYSWESGIYQYGWVDIGRSFNAEVQGSVYTVYGWAWDTTPNETINAGAFVGNVSGGDVAAVPEPSSLAMMLIGLTGFGGYAARKHFKRSSTK